MSRRSRRISYVINNLREEEVYTRPSKRKKVIRYYHQKEFDGDIPMIGDCFDWYEDCSLCHVVNNGIVRCYSELEVSEDTYEMDKQYLKDII